MPKAKILLVEDSKGQAHATREFLEKECTVFFDRGTRINEDLKGKEKILSGFPLEQFTTRPQQA